MNKKRFTIECTEKVMDILTYLSVDESIAKAEVIRRSIALYHYVNKEVRNKNCTLGIVKDDEIIRELVMTL